jgi:hypothetical protein
MSVQVDAQAEGTSYEFSGGGRFSTRGYVTVSLLTLVPREGASALVIIPQQRR